MTIPAPFLAAAFAILLMVSPNLYAEPFVSGFDRFAEHSAQAGRVLLTELSCTACHAGPKTLAPKRGPVLEGASKRYRHAWLRQFLLDPAATKPGTTMPQVMHQIDENARDQVVDQLLAYLALQSTPEPKVVSTSSYPVAVEFWNKGNQAKGRELYHQLGCVACHAMDDKFQPEKTLLSDLEKRLEKFDQDPEDMKELGLKIPKPVRSVPHGDLVAKYSRRSLSMFLIAPHLLRPSLRMPDLRVHPTDAAHLAAYLLRDKPLGPAVGQLQPSTERSVLAQQGAKQFRRLGCSQWAPRSPSPLVLSR